MRLAEVRIEGRERRAIIRYPAEGDRVLLTLCDNSSWEGTEPEHDLDVQDTDDAWICAESAHCCIEGFAGTKGDIQDYYELFVRAIC